MASCRGMCWIIGRTPHPRNCNRWVNRSRSLIVCRSHKFKISTAMNFHSRAVLTSAISSLHWVITYPFDLFNSSKNVSPPLRAPSFPKCLYVCCRMSYFRFRLELGTVGSLGHYPVQSRWEIPTTIRGGQDVGQGGGCKPGSF